MQTKSKNKMVTGSEPALEEYHFSGGGEYVPVTVKATSREEAEAEWEKVRVKVTN